MKKFIKVKNWLGRTTVKRMVNQDEIVNFITENPGLSENNIMFKIYGFSRGGMKSNKKYADCLRRALRAGKICRKVKKGRSSKYFYYPVN